VFQASLGEPLGVADRHVMHASVAVMHETIRADRFLAYNACSIASSTKSVRADDDAFQPTIRRANTSMTKTT
jgi:hypothetical protein